MEPPRRTDIGGIQGAKIPGSPGPGRLRMTLGALAALVLLLVVGGVLGFFIRQANSQSATSDAAPAPVTSSPSSAASPVATGPARVVPAPEGKPPPSPLSPEKPPAKAETAPAPNLPATATFEVAATAASVTVRSRDLGTDLYRVTLAKGRGSVTAKVSDNGANHRLTLAKAAGTAAPPITITLNSGVRWSLRMTAGNTETTVNLTQSKLASLELAGGADAVNLSLPSVTGTLPLRVTHGMNQLKINTNDTPVRATLRAGAGKVVIDGNTHTSVAAGATFTSDGLGDAANRVDLDATNGLGTLTVDTD